jgi:1-acyl-sn-glycerol-3-phosphate acyltransferase
MYKATMKKIFYALVRFCVSLRYRVKIVGLEQIKRQGSHGLLFLPNHPAEIDPLLLSIVLEKLCAVSILS